MATTSGAATSSTESIQAAIDALHIDHHNRVEQLVRERDVRKNALYAERAALLKEQGPKHFWATVIRSHKELTGELLGPYDDEILDALEDVNVVFTPNGYKLDMTFAKNDFFSDAKLWAESVSATTAQDGASGDDDLVLRLSGVNWKAGKGPLTPEEEDALASKEKVASPGDKRGRQEEAANDRGPSLFSFFEELLPPAGDDHSSAEEDEEEEDEEDEEDDEEMSEMGEYLQARDERHEVLECLVREVFEDPAGCFAGNFNPPQAE